MHSLPSGEQLFGNVVKFFSSHQTCKLCYEFPISLIDTKTKNSITQGTVLNVPSKNLRSHFGTN